MSEAIKPLDEDLEKINMFDPELMACPHAFFQNFVMKPQYIKIQIQEFFKFQNMN